ncbi:MAG: hypothetical protein ACFFCS_12700 [Candidatus Hodarchaeota archaeon]
MKPGTTPPSPSQVAANIDSRQASTMAYILDDDGPRAVDIWPFTSTRGRLHAALKRPASGKNGWIARKKVVA